MSLIGNPRGSAVGNQIRAQLKVVLCIGAMTTVTFMLQCMLHVLY
jgi:hypothetical protein